ncbi:eukaryotic translation initiation factor 3 subunit E [Malassezia vespertilionis]|uniref:eukaryotic translation initiation factor 3 subunit E n=1 Tax=Malassezia vespertilionis TaxID=2020962 RepID=UPI0024B16FD0|nr:eukaryotic translation initiation factor 3 subunit E [Malassezia vespertilionis]WFD06428.1 eukaryotic translation initiation factor 3 subunit E [Malassezia vespertilionis]
MAAQYDLTQTLLGYLDSHLGLPLLSHIGTTNLFNAKDLLKAQYELSQRTAMVDYSLQLHKEAYPGEPEPEEISMRREEVVAKNAKLQKEVEKVLNVIRDPNVANALKQDKALNFDWLKQNYNLTLDEIDALYHYGYFQYSCGNYSEASSYLYHFCVLSPDNKLTSSAMWGKLACDILTGEWERAMDDVRQLREHIDARRATASIVAGAQGEVTHEEILQKRAWLLHWSLFVFFNHPAGRVKLVELFLSPAYMSTLQISCPWLLRYLVVALVITRRQVTRGYVIDTSGSSTAPHNNSSGNMKLTAPAALRDLSKTIQMESYRLNPDPFVDFFFQLYVELNFDRAQEELAKANEAATQDFFLQEHVSEFIEDARFLVSEVYCRIHQNVKIDDLSKRLNMSKEDGEKWIVTLICDTKTDAKIDLKDGIVRMNQPRSIVYQSVIDKTRGITFRTSALAQAMDRRAHPPLANNDGRRGTRQNAKAGANKPVAGESAPVAEA